MTREAATTGSAALDALLGGLVPGDNVVWIGERDDRYELAERAFLTASAERHPTVYVATNRVEMARKLPPGVERLDATTASGLGHAADLAEEIERRLADGRTWCVVIDGLGTLARRWGPAEALMFFARACPTMLQAGALTYWRAPRSLGAAFLDRVRQITQVMLEVRGDQLHVLKAESRPAAIGGSVHRVGIRDGDLTVAGIASGGRLARGLASVRRDLGLTQAQLAELAGITPSAVSQAESGTRGLSVDTLIALSDRLGITLDRLVSARPSPGYHLARHDRRRPTATTGIVPLADDPAIGLRAFLVVLEGDASGTPPTTHKGVELVAVVRGLVQVGAGDDTPVLRAGDSLVADTASVRSWRNLRPEPAMLYWILRD